MKRLTISSGMIIGCLLIGCAQKTETLSPSATPATKRTAPLRVPVENSKVSEIAQREIIRRQEMVRTADRAAMQAGQLNASGDLSGAVEGYRSALQTLPSETR